MEVKQMVEIEVRKTDPETQIANVTNVNINEIVGQISGFVDGIRQMSSNAEPMSVNVERFNVSVGKVHGEYEVAVKLNLLLKPKIIIVEPLTQ